MTDSLARLDEAAGGDDDGLRPPASRVQATAYRRRRVLAGYRARTIATDVLVIVVAGLVALIVRGGDGGVSRLGVHLPVLAVLLLALWIGALVGCGTYLERVLSVGPDEYRRVLVAGGWVFLLMVVLTYIAHVDVSRLYLTTTVVLAVALCLLCRWLGRRWLARKRDAGGLLVGSAVIGDPSAVDEVTAVMNAHRYAGYRVVAGLTPTGTAQLHTRRLLAELDDVLASADVGAVVITAGAGIDEHVVRAVARHLERSDIDLLMSPDLAVIASPRRTFSPASGLPLMHCDEAALTPMQLAAKRALDLVGVTVGLVILGIPMLVIAAAVRLTSDGPALFRQLRVGRDGQTFKILKYRTMTVGSEHLRDDLRLVHGHDEPGFKVADDPRVTRLGRVLRRWSLDELPQLINVLRGDMTLVGPRPHPLDDVTRYRTADHRRLLVRPGMTGLWQVTGRSSLPWGDGVKLDLYYIETWSLAGDIILLVRTVKAVLTGHGAS